MPTTRPNNALITRCNNEAESDELLAEIVKFAFKAAPRAARSITYLIAAMVLSYALPQSISSVTIISAVLVLSLTNRTIIIAEIILLAMAVLAFVPVSMIERLGA